MTRVESSALGWPEEDLEPVIEGIARAKAKLSEKLLILGHHYQRDDVIRFADFTTVTRSRTLGSPTDIAHEIYRTARELYAALGLQRVRIRLVGVRLEGLVEAVARVDQLSLLPGDDPEPGEWRAAEQAADSLRARFGSGVVRPARLVSPPEGSPDGHDPDSGISRRR